MLINKNIMKIIECKSSKDGHIVEIPIILPCGFSSCKDCLKKISYCNYCDKEHQIQPENALNNNFVSDLIKTNIKKLSQIINGGKESMKLIIDLKINEVKDKIDLRAESLKLELENGVIKLNSIIDKLKRRKYDLGNNFEKINFLKNLDEKRKTLRLLLNSTQKSINLNNSIGIIRTHIDIDKSIVTAKHIATLEGHSDWVICLAELKNGELISVSFDKSIKIWDMEKKTLVNTLETHDSWILCFLELKSGEVLIGSQDKTIKMYDLDNKTCKLSLEGHEDGVRCLAEMRNGEILSGSADKTIKLWNLKTKTCKLTLKGHNGSVKCLIILMNGNLLSGSTDTSLRLWSLKSKNCILVLKGHSDMIWSIIELKSGYVMSGSSDRTIRNLKTKQCLSILEGHTGCVCCLLELSNGEVISGSGDKTIRVWDLKAKSFKAILNESIASVRCLLELKNGEVVSTAYDTIKVWK